MSVGAKTAVRRAVVSGLAESLAALSPTPAVFPAPPGEDIDGVSGTAWISGVSVAYVDGGLGAGSGNQYPVVSVKVSFEKYGEASQFTDAVEQAEDGCDELVDTFKAWLDQHVSLTATCTHALLGEEHTQEAYATESGASVVQTLTVVATCRPPFANPA